MKYITAIFIFIFSHSVFSSTESIVNEFIKSKYIPIDSGMVSDTQSGQLVSYVSLDDDNKQILVNWVYMVANYWQYRITLIEIYGDSYNELSTISSEGKIEDLKAIGDKAIVTQIVYSPKAARCCPDIEFTSMIDFSNNTLRWLNENH